MTQLEILSRIQCFSAFPKKRLLNVIRWQTVYQQWRLACANEVYTSNSDVTGMDFATSRCYNTLQHTSALTRSWDDRALN